MIKHALYYSLVTIIAFNALLLLSILVFRPYINKIILVLFSACAVSGWINATFLVGTYGEFDGRGNIQVEPLSNLTLVQTTAFLILAFLFYKLRNDKTKIRYILGSILLVSFVSGLFSFILRDTEKIPLSISESSYFQYSANNPNVLFILLDEYQSDYFAHALDDQLRSDFQDFIWFKDTVANFPTTIAALPALLTGEIYKNDITLAEFYQNASKRSIAKLIADHGGVVTYTQSPPNSEKLFPEKSFTNFNNTSGKDLSTYNALVNYAIFRYVPDFLKRRIYNDEKWLVQLSEKDIYLKIGGKGASIKLLNHISEHKIERIEEYPTTFKFHHSVVTHSPTVLNSDCLPIEKVDPTIENKKQRR